MHSTSTVSKGADRVNRRPRAAARGLAIVAALSGCSQSGSPPPEAPIGSARCAVQEANALRLVCEVVLSRPGPVVVVVEDGEIAREARSAAGVRHEVTVWGLRPDRELRWRVVVDGEELAGGTAWTGALPEEVRAEVVVEGTAPVDGVLARACASTSHLVVLDGDGEVIWYEDLAGHVVGDASVLGYAPSDGGVVAAVGREHVVEVSMGGEVTAAIDLGALGLEGVLHHDVAWRDGVIYGLYAYLHEGSVYDGVYGWAGGALVLDLPTHGLLGDITGTGDPPPGVSDLYWFGVFGTAPTVSHANSVSAAPGGGLVLSLRTLDAVIAVRGDQVDWVLAGGEDPPLLPTYRIESDVTADLGFAAPHAAGYGPSGRLVLLDNGLGGETARALVVALDASAGTATIEEVYDTGHVCPEQSSAYELDRGGVLVTCATDRWIGAFERGGSVPTWTLGLRCEGPPSGVDLLPRGIPVPVP